MSHTLGLLHIVHGGTIKNAAGRTVARMNFPPVDEAEDNARRFVACWNACDGIPTESLENDVVVGFMADLKRQNAKLKAALKKAKAKS